MPPFVVVSAPRHVRFERQVMREYPLHASRDRYRDPSPYRQNVVTFEPDTSEKEAKDLNSGRYREPSPYPRERIESPRSESLVSIRSHISYTSTTFDPVAVHIHRGRYRDPSPYPYGTPNSTSHRARGETIHRVATNIGHRVYGRIKTAIDSVKAFICHRHEEADPEMQDFWRLKRAVEKEGEYELV